ncbi:cuticle protein 70 precursor [Tribolium castaneum]|uniref:Uncharacterized protein n=1 Tax=Tribolium castaneum TaxID=7070 RepID=D6WG09_TRICA|nr:cuticle protein 70 precursor [Tribolium castaneum]EFA00229.1 hypothetical protein TcasGA2_TC003056 [Tribolium castaneum]|eukprot:XP_008196069.1 PREDICTED: cuticle protein 70, isoforms A and B [Tribolium castaneum]
MLKLLVFVAAIYGANAGVITTGLGIGHGAVVAAAPVAVATPVVKTVGATSYQNYNQISLHPTAVVAHAPVAVAHAPVAVAHAPIAVAHAPIAVAHAPVAVAHVGSVGLGSIGIGKIGLEGLGEEIGIKGI